MVGLFFKMKIRVKNLFPWKPKFIFLEISVHFLPGIMIHFYSDLTFVHIPVPLTYRKSFKFVIHVQNYSYY